MHSSAAYGGAPRPGARGEARAGFRISVRGIQESSRHKSGIAVRFPRMARWRHDKKPMRPIPSRPFARYCGDRVTGAVMSNGNIYHVQHESSVAVLLVAASAALAQTPQKIAFDSDTEFLKLNYQMNLGEVLGVAVNSKGTIVVLNHPAGDRWPVYGNASTSCWNRVRREFVRELAGRVRSGLRALHPLRQIRTIYGRRQRHTRRDEIQSGRNGDDESRPTAGRPRRAEYFSFRKIAQNPPTPRRVLQRAD